LVFWGYAGYPIYRIPAVFKEIRLAVSTQRLENYNDKKGRFPQQKAPF